MEIYKNGFKLVVKEDLECSHNPRQDECLGTLVYFHKRYTLGDKHNFKDPQELKEWLKNCESELACALPVYMYEHSGIAFSTTPFSCPWDSGQIGYIYTTHEKLKDFFGKEKVSENKLKEILKQELSDYEKYVSGEQEFYSFAIYNSKNERVDSCTGFELIDDNFEQLLENISEGIDKEYSFLIEDL